MQGSRTSRVTTVTSRCNDKLSKQSRDRYFPYAAHEFISRVKELSFAVFEHDERLPVFLENCDVECPLGYQLCSFFRLGYIAQFSLPLTVPVELARAALDAVLPRLREIDAGPRLAVRDQQFVIYRAYFRPISGVLSVAQHVMNGGHRSYLRFKAASQLAKAQRHPDGQTVLFEVRIT
jgi:hypothetical protein